MARRGLNQKNKLNQQGSDHMRMYMTVGLAALVAAPAMAETEITFGYWGDPAELPPFEKIVADYEAANPDVNVTVQHAPWSGYFTRLDAQLAAGAGPDVFFITNVPSYAARGALEPLDSYVEETGFPIEEYNQEALRSHSLDGQLYSFPRDNATIVLYYNIDAFDEAGVEYPSEDWRWDDLRAAAKELTVSDGGRVSRYGLVVESNDWPIWMAQNGGYAFDDPIEPTTFTMAEPEAVEAIQYVADMINEDRSMPSFLEAGQAGGTTQMFLSEQAAMAITNAARLGSYANADFEWGIAPLPAGPDGIRKNRIGGAGFAMNANSANKDAAWDFLSYLAGPEGQATFASAASPAVPAMTGNDMVRESFQAPSAEIFLSETEHGELLSQFPTFVDISNLYIQPALDLVWNGEQDAQTALSAIADDVQERLDQDNQ